MDPLYQLVNQNRLLDNTQRSSDNLKAQAIKEGKEKTKRTGEIDDSDLSGDINSMGEDLLGSMDPDLFGGGGGAKAFKQMWEETLADDQEEEKKEKDGEGEGKKDDEEEEEDESSQDFDVKPPTVSAELPGATPALPRAEPDTPAVTVSLSTEARQETRAPQDGPQEEVELAAPERKAPSAAEAPSWSSLLDLTGGFLIAEEILPELSEDEEAGSAQDDVPDVCPSVADLLTRLIVGDATTQAYRRLQHLLGRFGAGVLRTCLDQKSRVFLLPRGEGLASHPLVASSGMDDARGAVYLTASRSCVVEEELLATAPLGFHPVLYYFAHAFDHALGGEDFASLRSPAVGASFQACQQGGHQFADPLAATSPVHYFAQAVESYLNDNDCYEPLWTRADLYDFDRSMYEYVDYLFKRANK